MADRTGYWLVILFIVSLILFSATGIYGIYEYNMKSKSNENWKSTPEYRHFMEKMNLLSLPAVVLMMGSLAICIPRRLISTGYISLIVGIILLIFIIYLVIYPLKIALGIFFLSLLLIQIVVLILTIMDRNLIYRKGMRMSRIGSALLHLSLTLFLVDITIVGSGLHLAVFWIAGAGFMVGSIMSFYGG